MFAMYLHAHISKTASTQNLRRCARAPRAYRLETRTTPRVWWLRRTERVSGNVQYLFNDVASARDADGRADAACGGKGAMTPSNACQSAREIASKEWADVPRSQALQNVSPELDILGGVGLLKALVSNFVRTFSLSLADVGAMVGAGGPKAIQIGGGMANAERYFGGLAKEYGATLNSTRGGVSYFDIVDSGVTYRVNLYPVSTSFKQPAISIGDTYKLRF
jgi:hypothetical protein